MSVPMGSDPAVVGGQMNMFLAVREVGDRVELAPHTDRWMRGDRFGTVEAVGRFYLHVRMDRSGETIKVVPENAKGIDE